MEKALADGTVEATPAAHATAAPGLSGARPLSAPLAFTTPWYHGWNVVAVCLLFQAMSFGGPLFCFTFFVRPWAESFQVANSVIMIASTAVSLAMGLIAPFAGRAIDRLSIRFIVALGAVMIGLGLLLLSVATAAWQVIAIYATLIATGLVICGPLPAQTLAARWFSARQGLALGFVTLGTSIGGMILPPLMTHLIGDLGWRPSLVILAGLTVGLIVPLALLVIRNAPEADKAGAVPNRHAAQPAQVTGARRTWTTAEILRERNFWVVVIAFAPIMMAFSIVQVNLAPFTRDHDINPEMASSLMSVMAFATILGKLVFGGYADQIDHRRLFWAAACLVVIGILALLIGKGFTFLLVVTAILGFAAGSFLPLLGAVMARAFGPLSFGSAMGLAGPFLTITAFGAPIAAWLRESTGSYEIVFMTLIALIVPAAVVMALLRTRKV